MDQKQGCSERCWGSIPIGWSCEICGRVKLPDSKNSACTEDSEPVNPESEVQTGQPQTLVLKAQITMLMDKLEYSERLRYQAQEDAKYWQGMYRSIESERERDRHWRNQQYERALSALAQSGCAKKNPRLLSLFTKCYGKGSDDE